MTQLRCIGYKDTRGPWGRGRRKDRERESKEALPRIQPLRPKKREKERRKRTDLEAPPPPLKIAPKRMYMYLPKVKSTLHWKPETGEIEKKAWLTEIGRRKEDEREVKSVGREFPNSTQKKE